MSERRILRFRAEPACNERATAADAGTVVNCAIFVELDPRGAELASPPRPAAVGVGDITVWGDDMFEFPALPNALRMLAVFETPDDVNLLDLEDARALLDRGLRPTQVARGEAPQHRFVDPEVLHVAHPAVLEAARTLAKTFI